MNDNQAQPNFFSSEQISSGNTVDSVTPDLTPVNNSRLTQQYVRPNSVKSTGLGPIITSSSSGLGNGTVKSDTITSGFTSNFVFTLRDNLGRTILALPDVSIYIGSISAANQWPNATYGMGSMPISVMNDWGLTDNINTVTRVVVRNNSGSPAFVIVVCRWRIITNSTVQLDQASTPEGTLTSTDSALFGGLGGL